MIAEDFIIWENFSIEGETERRLQLVDLIMLELDAVPMGKKKGYRTFCYNNKYFYFKLENETKIALYSSDSKRGNFVKVQTIDGDSLVCIFYEAVQEILRLVPNDNDTSVPLSKNGSYQIEHLLAESENFAVTHEFETAFLFNKKNQTFTEIGFFYDDPEYALIDKNEKFCVVVGESIYFFDMNGTELKKIIPSSFEYTYYIKQLENKIIVRKENIGLIEIDCDEFIVIPRKENKKNETV